MYTTNCIECLKPATVWTCHVLYGSRKEKITAGWCKAHLHCSGDYKKMTGAACFGVWKPEYGKAEKEEIFAKQKLELNS